MGLPSRSPCLPLVLGLMLLLGLWRAPAAAYAQAADTTFLNRNIRQQLFLLDYLKEHQAAHPPVSPAELDAYLSGAAAAWAQSVPEEDTLVRRLNPYVFMWLLHKAYAGAGLEAPEQAECHTYAAYAVPAFLDDFRRYRDVSPVHAPLLHVPSHDWAGGPLALHCDLGPAQWAPLRAAFEAVPAVARRYLEQDAYADAGTADDIRRVQRMFEQQAPLYTIRDAVYRGELDAAFAGLAAAATQAHGAYFIRPLGRALQRAYLRAGRADHALATLDLLARVLTATDLPPDTLRAWYAEAEPARGSKRFEQMAAARPATLVPSDDQVDLTGAYTDLQTNAVVDWRTVDGRFVLLDFWATWCGPCVDEVPRLRAFRAAYGDRVALVSVNADAVTATDDPAGVRRFMEAHGIDYPVLYDRPAPSLVARFGVRGYPALFLISPAGTLLVHPSEGRRTVSLAEVQEYLDGRR